MSEKSRPVFSEGHPVSVDWQAFKGLEPDTSCSVLGKIRGLVSSGPFEDLWIVDFGHILSKVYPYSCYVVPHSYLTPYTGSYLTPYTDNACDLRKELGQEVKELATRAVYFRAPLV